MTPRPSTYWHRLALATLLAGAASLTTSAFGDAAVAYAAPREWDIGRYDSCVADALAFYQTGEYTFQDYHEDVKTCCLNTGGDLIGDQCVAPPAEQAQEAERQPAGPALPEVEATLYMPPPVGPVGPPPSEATLAP